MNRIGRTGAALLALGLLVPLVSPTDVDAQRGGRGRRAERREERRDDRQDRVAEVMTGWTRLGERWVQGGVDHDTIAVGARDGTFRRIALRVEHSSLELFDVVITFGDGTTFSPPTRLIFAPDTASRTIDLPGDARVIRRVDFRYANLPGGGRAQLELWAQ
jgi:hypothetical protein